MSATMIDMELIFADRLNPGQLMLNDLIGVEDDVVEVIGVNDTNNGDDYQIEFIDEFGEKDIVNLKHDELVSLYVYVEDDE
jgi:hypothetical protein